MKFALPDYKEDFQSYADSLKPNIPLYIKSLYEAGMIDSITPINSQTTGITVAFKQRRPNASVVYVTNYGNTKTINTSDVNFYNKNATKNILVFGHIIVDNASLDVISATIHNTIFIGYSLTSYPQKLIKSDNVNLKDILTTESFKFFNAHALYSRHWYLLLKFKWDSDKLKLFDYTLDDVSTKFHIEEILSIYQAGTYAQHFKK